MRSWFLVFGVLSVCCLSSCSKSAPEPTANPPAADATQPSVTDAAAKPAASTVAGAIAAPASPSTATTTPASGEFSPAETWFPVEIEKTGRPKSETLAFVFAADESRAYLTITPRAPFNLPPETPEQTKAAKYVAVLGSNGTERRVELEFVTKIAGLSSVILAAAKELVPPPLPLVPLPEVTKGDSLKYVATWNLGPGNRMVAPFGEKQVEVLDVLADDDGIATSLQVTPGLPRGVLLDAGGNIIALYRRSDWPNTGNAVATTTLAYHKKTMVSALKSRITKGKNGEDVAEFAIETIDPFESGLQPIIRRFPVPPAQQPDRNSTSGPIVATSPLLTANGVWLKPPGAEEIRLTKVDAVEPDFGLTPTTNPWCRASLWKGSRPCPKSDVPVQVPYHCDFVDGRQRLQADTPGGFGILPIPGASAKNP